MISGCWGACEEHRGQVKLVRVLDLPNSRDWGLFWYCDEAIETDRKDGLTVHIQEDEGPNK
jgi:hypothetical protein